MALEVVMATTSSTISDDKVGIKEKMGISALEDCYEIQYYETPYIPASAIA